MPMDPELMYRQLGRLIETMPRFYGSELLSADALRWLGRVQALVTEAGDISITMDLNVAMSLIPTNKQLGIEAMKMALYRAFATAELKAPASVQGSFIPVGKSFDAYAALAKVLQTATKDVLVIDPFMDETALTEFGGAVPAGIHLRLLADQKDHKPTLLPATKKWTEQYSTTRPLSVRLALHKTLHDRAIFIDQTTAWTLTQSLKDFAKRSPAEIVRADDTAALKIAAYEAIWVSAQVVI